jgi:hypothetical protein
MGVTLVLGLFPELCELQRVMLFARNGREPTLYAAFDQKLR